MNTIEQLIERLAHGLANTHQELTDTRSTRTFGRACAARLDQLRWSWKNDRYYSFGQVICDAEIGIYLHMAQEENPLTIPQRAVFAIAGGFEVVILLQRWDAGRLVQSQDLQPAASLHCGFKDGELVFHAE